MLTSTVAVSVYIPSQQSTGSLFSTPSTVFVTYVFDDSHSDSVIPIVVIFISLIISDVEHLFTCLLAILSLEKYLGLLLIFFF